MTTNRTRCSRRHTIFLHRFQPFDTRCRGCPGVPLGTPTGVLHSLKGVGDGPNFLRGSGPKKVGVSQGGAAPLVAFFAYFLSHHRK